VQSVDHFVGEIQLEREQRGPSAKYGEESTPFTPTYLLEQMRGLQYIGSRTVRTLCRSPFPARSYQLAQYLS
jgi:hypothetical protein